LVKSAGAIFGKNLKSQSGKVAERSSTETGCGINHDFREEKKGNGGVKRRQRKKIARQNDSLTQAGGKNDQPRNWMKGKAANA